MYKNHCQFFKSAQVQWTYFCVDRGPRSPGASQYNQARYTNRQGAGDYRYAPGSPGSLRSTPYSSTTYDSPGMGDSIACFLLCTNKVIYYSTFSRVCFHVVLSPLQVLLPRSCVRCVLICLLIP